MIPWIIMAVVAVPLVVIAFMAMRRRTAAGEVLDGSEAEARTDDEFAEAEAYEEKWREEDKDGSTGNACPSDYLRGGSGTRMLVRRL